MSFELLLFVYNLKNDTFAAIYLISNLTSNIFFLTNQTNKKNRCIKLLNTQKIILI